MTAELPRHDPSRIQCTFRDALLHDSSPATVLDRKAYSKTAEI